MTDPTGVRASTRYTYVPDMGNGWSCHGEVAPYPLPLELLQQFGSSIFQRPTAYAEAFGRDGQLTTGPADAIVTVIVNADEGIPALAAIGGATPGLDARVDPVTPKSNCVWPWACVPVLRFAMTV